MALSDFSNGIYTLLDSHSGNLPLYSLEICYASEVGNLSFDDQGVPLEHYVTCVPDIELCVSINRVKYLKWSKKINCDESDGNFWFYDFVEMFTTSFIENILLMLQLLIVNVHKNRF